MDFQEVINLSDDAHGALLGADENQVRPGSTHLHLMGLYRFVTNAPVLEIELVELSSLHRSITYASINAAYLLIPKGQYQLFYRMVGSRPEGKLELIVERVGFFNKAALYLKKVLNMGASPTKWMRAFRSHFLSKSRAIGLRVTSQSSATVSTQLNRVSIHPIDVPTDTSVSIIIPTKIRHDLLRDCIKSLAQIAGVTYEIIIIDNGAKDPAMLKLLEDLQLSLTARVFRHDIAFNFSTLCNLGAAEARNPLLLFLNDDIEALDGHWLSAMCGHLLRPDVGVVGARLLYPSGDLQHAGIATNMVPGPGHPWRHAKEETWRVHPLLSTSGEVDAVTGACLLIRKSHFDLIGGFDETQFPITLNDADLCLKIRQLNLKVVFASEATLKHKESQSRPDDQSYNQFFRLQKERAAFLERYPEYTRQSVFFPPQARRDSERCLSI